MAAIQHDTAARDMLRLEILQDGCNHNMMQSATREILQDDCNTIVHAQVRDPARWLQSQHDAAARELAN